MTDVAVASCDRTALPQEHYIEVWIERKHAPGAEWEQVSNKQEPYSWKIPNSEHTGFAPLEVPVTTACVEGEYRAAAYVEGVSAPLSSPPDGEEFEFTIVSIRRGTFSSGDCAAGAAR